MSDSKKLQKELIKGVNGISSFKRNKWKPFVIALIIIITSTIGYFSNDSYKKVSKQIPSIDPNQNYSVSKVVDGDTFDIKVEGQVVKVRMIGVDTPETVDPRKTVQCFGKEASDKTKELLVGHSVTLETDPSQGVSDRFGRILAYVYREDGLFINKYMIENGYAHEYTYNIPYQKQIEFKDLEKQARENKIGLWGSVCNVK